MSTLVLLTITGLGLAALYFLVASGLSLIFGLMDVLNFAHGALVTVGGYLGWTVADHVSGGAGLALSLPVAIGAGALAATLIELAVIRPLYQRPTDQVLATVGLGLAIPALVEAGYGPDAKIWTLPRWLGGTISIAGAHLPTIRFVLIAAAGALLIGLRLLVTRTRAGLIVRAGVEDREMVAALGIDVPRTFTAIFALGGGAAGLAGLLYGLYQGSVSPTDGTSLLIFAFVVVVLGGMGSITGSAVAAVVVGLVQQYANYVSSSLGSESVVILLAIVLLARRRSSIGRPA